MLLPGEALDSTSLSEHGKGRTSNKKEKRKLSGMVTV
jgi:hypothetical protein